MDTDSQNVLPKEVYGRAGVWERQLCHALVGDVCTGITGISSYGV